MMVPALPPASLHRLRRSSLGATFLMNCWIFVISSCIVALMLIKLQLCDYCTNRDISAHFKCSRSHPHRCIVVHVIGISVKTCSLLLYILKALQLGCHFGKWFSKVVQPSDKHCWECNRTFYHCCAESLMLCLRKGICR